MRDNKEEALRWIKQAKEDLDVAKYIHQGKKFFASCFYSHQTVEKALKGYLIYKGVEHIWGHSVLNLLKECLIFDKNFNKFKEKVVILDRYYIPTRYPNGLPGGIPAEVFTEKDSIEAISIAEEIFNFIGEVELDLKIE